MENDVYNIDNLEQYHNEVIEKIKNSRFQELYENNKIIIKDNLEKYKIIHIEFGKCGKFNCKIETENNSSYGFVDGFYIIYISINGDCFGNYTQWTDNFDIIKDRYGNIQVDWSKEIFIKPFFNKYLSESSKILTKSLLEDVISKNLLIKVIKDIDSSNYRIHSCHCNLGLQYYTISGSSNIEYKNIFLLQEEDMQEKKLLEQKIKEEQEKMLEEQKIEEQEKNDIKLKVEKRKIKIIDSLVKLLDNFINNDEAESIIIMILHNNKKMPYFNRFFKYKDKNTLLALQTLNKFANENKIRVEDSITLFNEYILEIYNKLDFENDDDDW
jgi:hypothetical protein